MGISLPGGGWERLRRAGAAAGDSSGRAELGLRGEPREARSGGAPGLVAGEHRGVFW